MNLLVGAALLVAGGLVTWRFSRGGGPYRVGSWPGLTLRGAGVLLGCALLLAGGQAIFGMAQRALPDLFLLAAAAFVPLGLATRLTTIPGAASAACGAYLLPRSLLSLVDPALEPPPLLLVPALAFDVSLWLRASDLAAVVNSWPSRRNAWRKREHRAREPGRQDRAIAGARLRAAIAGGLFGLIVAVLHPPFARLLGADPAIWSGADFDAAVAACAGICAVLGGLSGRGKEW